MHTLNEYAQMSRTHLDICAASLAINDLASHESEYEHLPTYRSDTGDMKRHELTLSPSGLPLIEVRAS